MNKISVSKDGRKALVSAHMMADYLSKGWSIDQAGTDVLKITSLEEQVRQLTHALEKEKAKNARRVFEPCDDRDMTTIDGWINELGLLSRHRNLKDVWARAAINTIYQNLRSKLVPGNT